VFDRILVPLEPGFEGGAALRWAALLGRRLRCPVTVVTVARNASATAAARDGARRAVGGLVDAGTVTIDVRVGDPAGRIAEAAEGGAPLLVLRTRARPAAGEAILGSMAAEVLTRVAAPLLLLGPSCEPPDRLERMAVCLDRTPAARAVLPVAVGLAAALGLRVLLQHVVYPPVEAVSGDAALAPEDREMYDVLIEETRRLAAEGLDVDYRVDAGTWPAETIVEITADRAVHLLALATHAKRGLTRLVAGSTAGDVLRRSPVPVLLVKPGEDTPIEGAPPGPGA
jgi:nucleotide-binding universal stress UspA family protein